MTEQKTFATRQGSYSAKEYLRKTHAVRFCVEWTLTLSDFRAEALEGAWATKVRNVGLKLY
jgi:hypothetical protein